MDVFDCRMIYHHCALFVTVPLDTIYDILPAKLLLKLQTVPVFVKLLRNYFPKRPSEAPLHTLSKLYDVLVGFVNPLYLRLCDGYCSVSDDLCLVL